MLDKKRIIVVEDEDDLRGSYKRSLERRGFSVDEAGNLERAIALVNAKTYHVALVDLMLAGRGVPNLDGLKVLQEFKVLDEGTKTVVLSSQNDPQISADTLQAYGASRYVKKEVISHEGYEKLAEIVFDILRTCSLVTFGVDRSVHGDLRPRGVLVFLAGEARNEPFLVDQSLRALKPKGGFRELERFLHDFLLPLTPLMAPLGKKERAVVEEKDTILHASFWAKALGLPITCVVTGARNLEKLLGGQLLPESGEQSEVKEARYVHGDLCGLVFKLQQAERSEFASKLE